MHGAKDRVTVLPTAIADKLRLHLRSEKATHLEDLARGHGRVDLPFALARKHPHAALPARMTIWSG